MTPPVAYTYDHLASPVHVDKATDTTSGHAESIHDGLSSFQRSDVAANAGDHIVLGIADEGLEATAAKVGGRTLMGDSAWRQTLLKAIDDPSTKFTVSLDGFSGSTINSQVMGAVTRALRLWAS